MQYVSYCFDASCDQNNVGSAAVLRDQDWNAMAKEESFEQVVIEGITLARRIFQLWLPFHLEMGLDNNVAHSLVKWVMGSNENILIQIQRNINR
ncbi:hypothetical protein RGQ29_014432 [Quercus rubra]|uniref:Uncharacterized protein n=1 Tax=Quercus rubra TaxID=3512 RepID=A0AAN7FMG7_QUERU|nr:hypothetical protein RGQ29_014432 [Quercus rubra]